MKLPYSRTVSPFRKRSVNLTDFTGPYSPHSDTDFGMCSNAYISISCCADSCPTTLSHRVARKNSCFIISKICRCEFTKIQR